MKKTTIVELCEKNNLTDIILEEQKHPFLSVFQCTLVDSNGIYQPASFGYALDIEKAQENAVLKSISEYLYKETFSQLPVGDTWQDKLEKQLITESSQEIVHPQSLFSTKKRDENGVNEGNRDKVGYVLANLALFYMKAENLVGRQMYFPIQFILKSLVSSSLGFGSDKKEALLASFYAYEQEKKAQGIVAKNIEYTEIINISTDLYKQTVKNLPANYDIRAVRLQKTEDESPQTVAVLITGIEKILSIKSAESIACALEKALLDVNVQVHCAINKKNHEQVELLQEVLEKKNIQSIAFEKLATENAVGQTKGTELLSKYNYISLADSPFCIVYGFPSENIIEYEDTFPLLGRFLSEEGDSVKAISFLDMLEENYGTRPDFLLYKGIIAIRNADYSLAIQLFEEGAKKQDTKENEALCIFYQGLAYNQQGEVAKALPYFVQATQKYPHSRELYTFCAVASFKQGEYEQSASLCEKALGICAGSAEDLANLGLCYKFLGNKPLALKNLLESVKRDPSLGYAKMYLEDLQRGV